ncbi:MAG: hypothetical protein HY553_01850, partial [Elusimicrobia bacterium]|nr:hypothetical protein [Elusimicrobiota bacterium]
VNVGVAVLAMVLLISAAAVAAFLIAPLWVAGGGGRPAAGALLYFVAVGLGFILVEIALVGRFVLFLGHPAYAVTVVIFLLLAGGGAGSWLSGRRPASPLAARRAVAFVAAGAAAATAVLPPILDAAMGLGLPAKLALSSALLLPLGTLMGTPFPSGLRALEGSREWAWALNAAASVLGSVLAISLAVRFGLRATLLSGGAAYLAAMLLAGSLAKGYRFGR